MDRQVNWDETYLFQAGYFSHVNAGWKLFHSDETSRLGEMPHLILTALNPNLGGGGVILPLLVFP